MIYLITDTHLGHTAIARYCNRPENFSDIILHNLKAVLKKEDTLIHLGDVAFNSAYMEKFLSLPGTKILVKGNHDTKSASQYMAMGFSLCCQELVMELNGVRIIFTHAPKYGHSYDINIHGHHHDLHREDFSRLYLPLCIEQMGYKPLALDENTMGVISSWSDKRHIPSLKEIQKLGQGNITEGPQVARDLYGSRTDLENPAEHWKYVVTKREEINNLLKRNPDLYRIVSLKSYEAIVDKYIKDEVKNTDELYMEVCALADKARCKPEGTEWKNTIGASCIIQNR